MSGPGPSESRPIVFGQLAFTFHAGIRKDVFRSRLRAALDALPVDALLAGMGGLGDRWETCLEETSERGIPLYLWHPLLENRTGRYRHLEAVGWNGARAQWVSVHLSKGRPGFRFFCPNHPEARRIALQTVARMLDSAQPSGLFLDKIRYPSPASGLQSAIGCFCDHCRTAANESGIDLLEVRARLSCILSGRVEATGLAQLGLGTAETSDPLLASWHRFRCRSITTIVTQAVELARRSGRWIGLDLFAPALSRLVGQDYEALTRIADWVKPMLYCRSWVPSGFPVEIDGLVRGLPIGGRASVAASLRCPIPVRGRLMADGLPQTLAVAQAFDAQQKAGAVPSLAGIEVADRPGICRMTPRHVARYARLLRTAGIAGVVASPDIVLASRANLTALARNLIG